MLRKLYECDWHILHNINLLIHRHWALKQCLQILRCDMILHSTVAVYIYVQGYTVADVCIWLMKCEWFWIHRCIMKLPIILTSHQSNIQHPSLFLCTHSNFATNAIYFLMLFRFLFQMCCTQHINIERIMQFKVWVCVRGEAIQRNR